MSIGPALPPHLQRPVQPALADDDDDDDYMPALPPDMVAKASSAVALPRRAAPPSPPRVSGPARQPQGHGFDDIDSDDDDVGPMPLPAHLQGMNDDPVRAFREREERRRKNAEEAAKPKKLERQEWMLKPPTSSDLLGSLDPTKLTSKRTFNRGTNDSRNMADNLWTETPQERQQRVADEVMGKKRRAVEVSADPDTERETAKRRKLDAELRKNIDSHSSRKESLVDQHERMTAGQKEDKETAYWDHERDIVRGGRLPIDASARKKMINDARGLSDRFGSGKAGSFL
ncbi:hypothetical protein BKA62DRAFT_614774 [Auriculariales sp. MPI-PUGE-AT-0066]|nr:hypothetical protein BKA62DRAFT_614774 [Auriculariales sp. MPI-PUGE-AT-0066]